MNTDPESSNLTYGIIRSQRQYINYNLKQKIVYNSNICTNKKGIIFKLKK